MSDFVFGPVWWLGIVLFGGMTIVSILEWRGTIRTPFERLWPATALGTGISCGTAVTALSLAGLAEIAGVRFTGLPFATPAIIMLSIVALLGAGLALAFWRTPPRWTIAPHLRSAPGERGDAA